MAKQMDKADKAVKLIEGLLEALLALKNEREVARTALTEFCRWDDESPDGDLPRAEVRQLVNHALEVGGA